MKILAIADEESKGLWEYFDKKKLEGVDARCFICRSVY